MSEQSRDQWAMEMLIDTLALEWHSSDPQARKVADAAAVEVERLQAAKTMAEEAELAAAQELDEVKAERDALAAQRDQLRGALEMVLFCDKGDTVYARTKARAALSATEGNDE